MTGNRTERWHPVLGMGVLFLAIVSLAYAVIAFGFASLDDDTSVLSYVLPGAFSLVCFGGGTYALSGTTGSAASKDST